MKFLWFILFICVMACIGIAYIFTDVIHYFFPEEPQTEIIVQSPQILK